MLLLRPKASCYVDVTVDGSHGVLLESPCHVWEYFPVVEAWFVLGKKGAFFGTPADVQFVLPYARGKVDATRLGKWLQRVRAKMSAWLNAEGRNFVQYSIILRAPSDDHSAFVDERRRGHSVLSCKDLTFEVLVLVDQIERHCVVDIL